MSHSDQSGKMTAGAIFGIAVALIVIIMGFSYTQDGDLNPFNNDEVMSIEAGDNEFTVEDDGNGDLDVDVDG